MNNEISTTVVEPSLATGPAMLLNADTMRALIRFAEVMAESTITVPAHLVGKPSDCMAIAMQAAQWGMNPFAVAQKTHVVSGRLGYEAQLVNAVVQTSGAIVGTFSYEFKGAGQDLECRVGAQPRGGNAIVWGEWLRNGDVKVRNSPLWAVNPKQQLAYLQVKNWARLYTPGAILGVYSTDELDGVIDAPSKPTGPQRRSAAAAPAPAPMVDEVPKDEQQATGAPAADAAPAADKPVMLPLFVAGAATAGVVTGGQVNYLRGKLKNAGIAEQSICDRYQAASIELLTAEQFDEQKSELLALA